MVNYIYMNRQIDRNRHSYRYCLLDTDTHTLTDEQTDRRTH